MFTATIFIAIAVLLRIISNPLANVIQKQLTSKGNHALLVNFLSYLFLFVICIFFSLCTHWAGLSSSFWLYSILGGIVGALGNGFLVKALHKGELSVLGPINAYKSVVGIIFGIFLLGEIPNFWGLLGIALIIFGSYFVLDTTAERFSWSLLKKPEIQFRIWAMVLTAIEAVFVKKVIIASNPTLALVSWCGFGALFSFLMLFAYRLDISKEMKKIKRPDFRLYFLLILCIGTMQFTTNYVFKHMPVGYALSLFQLSIVLSILFGHSIFKEQDIRKKLVGALIMMAGSALIILVKES